MPKLIIIDGHSQLYKAFHAVAPLATRAGEPTGAVFGFMQIFHRIRKTYSPDHICVVFDPPGASFRSEQLASYKEHRPPQPPELTTQVRLTHELLAAMRVPVFEIAPFEADDVIASLSDWAVANGGEALIVSVDKDLLQCVRPGVTVLREHLGKIDVLDEQGVFEKMGVRPNQVADYLGMLGDASDNIPGIPGVGKKRAAELLNEFGSMEAVIAAAQGREKPKFWAAIAEHAETGRLSARLATLKRDIPLDTSWDKLRWSYGETPELRPMLERLEFRNYIEDLGGPAPPPRTTNYATVCEAAALDRVVQACRGSGLCAIDTETTGLDPFYDSLVGISLSWERDQGVYIPVGHEGLSLEEVRAGLSPALADPGIRWIAHNWSFDYKFLDRAGFTLPGVVADTMVMSFLLEPDRATLGLKPLALEVLGIKMTNIGALIGDGGDLVSMASVDVDRVSDYACTDADATRQLAVHFEPLLAKAGLDVLAAGIEMPLVPVLARMELEGVRIDREHFKRLGGEVAARLATLTAEIHALAGRPFNINSTKQLGEILFDELNLPRQKKTTTGWSTDVTVLEALSDKHPLPAKLLEYRQLEKLRGTYIESLPSLVKGKTGRIHTSFNQTVAATGRLSSSDPNLQNIPVRTEMGRQIRAGFIPRESGWMLVAADYSQIELRILAHMSGDEALREAFLSGGDVHALTAARIFHKPLPEVGKAERDSAKAINFGIIYGMTAFRLGRDLGMGTGEAERFIENYFKVYAGVKAFIDRTLEECRRDGYVRTLAGRRRFIPDINAANHNARMQAERIAVNTPIQGTSADMIKVAMIRSDARLRREGLRARMILQVHDELILDAPEEEVGAVESLLVKEMASAMPLDVPVKVDVGSGSTWAEL